MPPAIFNEKAALPSNVEGTTVQCARLRLSTSTDV